MTHTALKKLWVELALPVLLFALLYVFSANSTNFYFPSLSAVLHQFGALWLGPRFVADVIPSFQRLMAGYLLACLLGIALGIPVGIYRPLRRAVEPVLEFFRAVPPVAMIPLLIVSMGFGDGMKITVIVAGAIWPILLNTVEGVKSIDPVLDETCRTYQIRGLARLRHFILPSASPQIIVGMRLGLSIGIVLMVISEMFAALDGLGSAIIYFQRSYEIPQMWSGVLMLGLFGFALSVVFRLFERWALKWYVGMRDLERRN
ncbi:ABC transporter permease [Variovorax sp. YR216]|uniref:ABC transporter permease n=1 Tax=Variovorax sp. YR216 TaxID=1882828 RepID=UPI0008992F89|nr:ABC transporter permease [Variovorax sp. YR216]SEB14535.1 ABC-type nitrate/sulfonate/bicarbonate transport system, permease component [Variovorax sp. YR216]